MIRGYLGELSDTVARAWNEFWFRPMDTATLGLIRILAGGMLFYTHAVWSFDLNSFFGAHAWQNRELVSTLYRDSWQWSHLWYMSSPTWLWLGHVSVVFICLLLTLGLWTRTTSILACLATLSYANRTPDAMYGLDQVNGFLALYLVVGHLGEQARNIEFSLDRWLWLRGCSPRERIDHTVSLVQPSIHCTLAIRLIQVHLALVYLFAGISKLQGEMWWDGTAVWGAIANLEYQSADLLWLVHHPWLVNLLTHVTVIWEISYVVLIWPRLSRPLVLLIAVPIHLGIGFGLGMMTFGLAMLIANLAFVAPQFIRAGCESLRLRTPFRESTSALCLNS